MSVRVLAHQRVDRVKSFRLNDGGGAHARAPIALATCVLARHLCRSSPAPFGPARLRHARGYVHGQWQKMGKNQIRVEMDTGLDLSLYPTSIRGGEPSDSAMSFESSSTARALPPNPASDPQRRVPRPGRRCPPATARALRSARVVFQDAVEQERGPKVGQAWEGGMIAWSVLAARTTFKKVGATHVGGPHVKQPLSWPRAHAQLRPDPAALTAPLERANHLPVHCSLYTWTGLACTVPPDSVAIIVASHFADPNDNGGRRQDFVKPRHCSIEPSLEDGLCQIFLRRVFARPRVPHSSLSRHRIDRPVPRSLVSE